MASRCTALSSPRRSLESGWGESKLSAKYHNYFGLKCGTKWTGPSVNMTTQEEYQPGVHTTIKDNFRVYGSMEEGVKGYFEFIQLARYQNLRGITDPQKYLETIKADGYATSSTYVENNMRLVHQYNLTQYDKEESSMGRTAQDVLNVMRGWLGYSEANGKFKQIIDLYQFRETSTKRVRSEVHRRMVRHNRVCSRHQGRLQRPDRKRMRMRAAR